MKKLFDRTQKDIEEEQMLLNELKKIEARKKERDRKTQDLQKLISQADQVSNLPIEICCFFFLNQMIQLISFKLNCSKAKHHKLQRVLANRTRKSIRKKFQIKFGHRVSISLSM